MRLIEASSLIEPAKETYKRTPMKRKRYNSNVPRTAKVACTVSAAALCLGVSQAATVGFNFQTHYCGAASYNGAIVTAPAFGIGPNGWENLAQMDTGYGCAPGYYTLNQVVDTTTSTDGLHPLPNGSLSLSWSGYTANVSGFGGYTRSGPHYTFGGNSFLPGNEQVYWGFIRDGVNFGPGSSGGDNNQPGYTIDITGLKSVFTNTPFAVQLIASADSMQYLTNAFIIDATANTTQSVFYPSTPPVGDAGDTTWIRGIGGGLSTASGSVNTDHLKIIGNRAAHAGDKVTGYNFASTISGFIVTDKPVISMPPNQVLACPGDTVVYSGYAVGVPPLSYQWRKNGVAIPGATTSTLGITNLNLTHNAQYDLVVNNAYGSAVSPPVSPDYITTTRGKNYIVDSNPNNPPLDGLDFGATWAATSGTRSGVMSFNAAHPDQIVVPGHTNLDAGVGTIMFWMHSSGLLDTGGNSAALFDRRTANGIVIAQNGSGQIAVQAKPSGIQDFSSASANLSDGNWHLIALTFDQSGTGQVILYVDGIQDTVSPNGAAWSWPAGQQIELGTSHDAANWQSYNGQMDDVRVYRRILTLAEVLSVFTTGALVDNNALVLRLNFDTAPVAGVTLNWQCPGTILQSADEAAGPYTDMNYAVAPYATAFRATRKFYRYHGVRTPTVVISNPYLM
jgi:hypothetical protein